MTRPPLWKDEEDVIKRVSEEIAEMHRLAYVEQATLKFPPATGPKLPGPPVRTDADIARAERVAEAAAWKGNFEPLAALIDPYLTRTGGKLDLVNNPAVAKLKPDTWGTVAMILLGDPMFVREKPKPKRKRGGQKKTEEQRRLLYPVHDAADDGELIADILRQLYTDQTEKHILQRAANIAARFEVTESGLKDRRLRVQLELSVHPSEATAEGPPPHLTIETYKGPMGPL